jgi:hypothetical protein
VHDDGAGNALPKSPKPATLQKDNAMPQSVTTAARRRSPCVPTLVVVLLVALLPACATKRVYLNDSERAALRREPIHVLHYASPLPEVHPPAVKRHYARVNLHDAPTGAEIQSNLGAYDPTLEVTRRFANVLGKQAGLRNLRIERNPRPLPVAKEMGPYREQFKNGALLEVWIERWSFNYLPVDWKTYGITLGAKARLTRVVDGRVLWNGGDCAYGGSGAGYDDRLVLADLKTSENRKVQAKIKQTVARIADECARQLLQDYATNK